MKLALPFTACWCGKFTPGVANTVPCVQVFKQLRDSSVRAIVGRLLDECTARGAALGMHLHFTDAAIAHIGGEGMDVNTGARKLRRAVTMLVEDKLADFVLARNNDADDMHVIVDSVRGEMFVYEGRPEQASDGEEKHAPTPESASQGRLVNGAFLTVLEPHFVRRDKQHAGAKIR